MVFSDWSCVENVGSCSLDGVIKHAGNSSYKGTSWVGNGRYATLTHNTFSSSKTQIVLWVYNNSPLTYGGVRPHINHSSYGDLLVTVLAYNTWEKYKITFWYDDTTNTKWGRVERWNGSSWGQVGTDSNFGSGSPSNGSLSLKALGYGSDTGSRSCWFDELEVYS